MRPMLRSEGVAATSTSKCLSPLGVSIVKGLNVVAKAPPAAIMAASSTKAQTANIAPAAPRPTGALNGKTARRCLRPA